MIATAEPQLSLLSPAGEIAAEPAAAPQGPQDHVRVLTANVQHASPARTHQQAVWLATQHEHDMLVLTEVAAGESGDVMARLLGEFDYRVHLPAPGEDPYRVLVAVRGGSLEAVEDVGVTVMSHRCVAARAKLPQGEIGVVGLYVPSRGPKEQRNVAKRAFQEAVAAALLDLRRRMSVAGPVVLTGDLNVVEPNHEPRYAVFGQWEYDFYRAFAEAGFADAFRLITPEGMDYSWYGRAAADGTRNGYRFDHTFITADHAHTVRACHYVHAIRDQGLTDHSAMALVIGV
ncbi:MAG: endonuclease/exonuclease/phosphatase family protein [Pseudonocardiaceae bacterium]